MSDLEEKIENVLTEARMVLPGVQALLGFQISAIFTDAFQTMGEASQNAHFAALFFLVTAIIILMTPAIHHRRQNGENTEAFHRFTSKSILVAMTMLAIGIGMDIYTMSFKILYSNTAALIITIMFLAATSFLWFGPKFFLMRIKNSD